MRKVLGRIAAVVLTLATLLYGVNAPLAQAATITLSSGSGTPNATMVVSGNFSPNETGISVTFDTSTVLASGITAGSTGLWNTNIVIPAAASGSHTISAGGSLTATISTTFTVVASLAAGQVSGPVGTSVTVTGAGYAASETGISIFWDGNSVVTGQVASAQGAWSANFVVPASTGGVHNITANGSSTPSPRTIGFNVAPSVTINRTSGSPGTTITISGSGFGPNEPAIIVTYDGIAVTSGLSANEKGSWSTPYVIPSSPAGSHAFRAYGSITSSSATSDIPFIVGAGFTLSQTSGTPGSSVTITGSGFGANETSITVSFDSTTVAPSIRANSSGSWTASFNVPSSPGGSHNVHVAGSTTTSVTDTTYTVTPTVAVSQATAAPGASLTVTGSGFAANETGITLTYDGNNLATGIRANATGSWTSTVTIPASPAGTHAIHAKGVTTLDTATSDVILNVTAGISAAQTSVTPGTSLTINGAGFAANETGITVTYDGNNVATGIRANATGSWTGSFVVPASTSGSHSLQAKGSTTTAVSVSEVVLTITPGISISQTSGAPGSPITVNGFGFAASETGITVMYNTNTVASGLRANAQGSWSTTFNVPASAAGTHTISAQGAVTQAAAVSSATFTSAASVTLNPAAGYVGATVQIDGSGFTLNSPIRIYYDDTEMPTQGATTDATGSFNRAITIPKSKAGAHTVRIVDSQRNEVRVAFTMDTTAPPIPNPSLPADGGRVGIVGGTMPTFRWSTSSDPSGVTYSFQIDSNADFSQPLVDKKDISSTQYTLTAADALPLGQYYWRVKAIDNATNESAWSQPRVVKSGLMPFAVLLSLIVVAVAALAVAAWLILRRLKVSRREAAGVAAGEAPRVVVTGQWRSIEGPSEDQQARGERPMPLRLALPQPEKGKKSLSTEEQARLKVIVDFAQSLPLVEAGYTVQWLIDLLESSMGIQPSTPVYEQLLKGDLQIHYEPAWVHHPTYQDLTSLLEGQPILQDLNAFVDAINRVASEETELLQEIYRDCTTEVQSGFLEKGGWNFTATVFSDATSWFMGKSLRDPSERDYSVKTRADDAAGVCWLYGEDATSFGGPIMQATDEKEGMKLRSLHLKLRRNYRNNAKAKDVVSMMTQLEIQRARLLSVFSQFGRLRQS